MTHRPYAYLSNLRRLCYWLAGEKQAMNLRPERRVVKRTDFKVNYNHSELGLLALRRETQFGIDRELAIGGLVA